MARVLIADKLAPSSVMALTDLECEVEQQPNASAAALTAHLEAFNPEILVVRSTRVTATHLQAASALAVVLRAGAGYGGYCFPKDVAAFYSIAKELGYDFELLRCIMDINAEQRQLIISKVSNALWNLQGKTVGVLGLSFKPNTDDMRGAPALDIIPALQQEGARVRAYDPAGMGEAKELLARVDLCASALECAEGADLLLFLTEWDEFQKLSDDDLTRLRDAMRLPIVVDGRNIFAPPRMQQLGFEYYSIGRP